MTADELETKTRDLCDKTIVDIYTAELGTKRIHFLAFGYCTFDDEEKPYRFVEYAFFDVRLDIVLKVGVSNFEVDRSSEYTQYIEDCDAETMISRYEHYDNGKTPPMLNVADLNMDTPDGMYILDHLRKEKSH